MALLRTPGIASGLSNRRVAGLGLVDSSATRRQVWAACRTAVRACGDAIQALRRALFFSVLKGVPEQHLKQHPWPRRNLIGA
jgi:hypothetical protein